MFSGDSIVRAVCGGRDRGATSAFSSGSTNQLSSCAPSMRRHITDNSPGSSVRIPSKPQYHSAASGEEFDEVVIVDDITVYVEEGL